MTITTPNLSILNCRKINLDFSFYKLKEKKKKVRKQINILHFNKMNIKLNNINLIIVFSFRISFFQLINQTIAFKMNIIA